jgi:hypothetical protein
MSVSLLENLAGRSLVPVGCAPPAILSRSIDFESGSAAEPWSAAQRFARISPRSLALQTETLAPDRSRDRAPSRNPTRSRCRQRRCVSHKNWRVQGCGGRSIASIDLRRRRQISASGICCSSRDQAEAASLGGSSEITGRTGSRQVTVVPWPSRLVMRKLPPCSSISAREMASPSPLP